MVKKIEADSSLYERYYKLKGEWDYIEDPTYSRSIDSHVCMTCSKFDYACKESFGTVLCCQRHQKLICQGQHLTHSCELYQKKTLELVKK